MGNLAINQANSKTGSPLFGNPLGEFARTLDLELAIGSDENALFGTGAGVSYLDLLLGGEALPGTPVVTNGGTVGSTSYTYLLIDVSNVGTAPSATASTSTGNATLTSTNYNIITAPVTPGHTYNIVRSASSGTPSSTGIIGNVTAGTTQTTIVFNDTGIAATTAQVQTQNTTGSIQTAGPAFVQTVVSGGVGNIGGKIVVASATGVTLTAAQILADILVRTTGSGGISDATPTAAAIVAALGPGARAGSMHKLEFRNEGTGTQTITAGTGVTLRAGNTNTIVTVATRLFTIVLTTVTPGSEAVEIISGPSSTY